MPRYSSRKKKAAKRERKRVRAAVPRDKRHLSHWAVRGTHDDYAKFRKHVADVQHRAPSYLEPGAMKALGWISGVLPLNGMMLASGWTVMPVAPVRR